MKKKNKDKIFEWIYRIFLFTILDSFITVIGFVGIYNSIKILTETNNLNIGTSLGILQAALAIIFLELANFFYWILDINLFKFKGKNEK